jgi:hypothetical protein
MIHLRTHGAYDDLKNERDEKREKREKMKNTRRTKDKKLKCVIGCDLCQTSREVDL